MKCEDTRLLMHAWLDQELDPANSKMVADHIAGCTFCKEKADGFAALSRSIKTEATHHKAPADLRSRIAGASAVQISDDIIPATRWAPFKWGGLGAALSMAACFALFLIARPNEQYLLQQEIVTSHIRSLEENHLTDVVSTDQHTVKPWFNGRLDISPPVVDLAEFGFPLAGGRLDYIDSHTAAVLVYKYNKHVINLFIWKQEPSGFPMSLGPAIQGYNIRHWEQSGLRFWAISDVNKARLEEFQNTYTSHTQ